MGKKGNTFPDFGYGNYTPSIRLWDAGEPVFEGPAASGLRSSREGYFRRTGSAPRTSMRPSWNVDLCAEASAYLQGRMPVLDRAVALAILLQRDGKL